MEHRDRHEHLLSLREQCARRIADLHLHEPQDIDSLCTQLMRLRNRPIRLVPIPMPATHPCGMWVAAQGEDLIFFDTNTTSAHQEHIILHELGHIICCHRGAGSLDDESARSLFPNLDPAVVRDMLMRTTYDDMEEQEAEIIAYLLAEMMVDSTSQSDAGPSDDDSAISRIERTLI